MHIEPTNESGRRFLDREIAGPVTMLNLLRFRPEADYSQNPELAPAEPITGRAAYERYFNHTLPFLDAAGAEVTFLGEGGSFLIGPLAERWDLVMLVRHASAAAMFAMAEDDEYLSGIGHRVAALEDSRLLPVEETPRHG